MAFDSRIVPGSAHPETVRKNLPFGQTDEEYAAALAEKRRLERRAKILQAQKEAQLAREAGQPIPGPTFTSPQPAVIGQKQGPEQTGSAKFKNGPIITVGRHIPSNVALTLVLGWYFTGQLFLFFASVGLFTLGGVSILTASPLIKIAEWLTDYSLTPYLGLFLAGGASVAVLNAAISLSLLALIALGYKLSGTNSLGGAENTVLTKYVLFGLAIVGYTIPFLQWLPWAIPWINYVKINPE